MLYFFIIWFCLSFIAYALYIQFSPGMGNIWWRQTDNGEYSFQPQNLFNLIKQSFSITLCQPELLDLNFIYFMTMALLLGIIIYCLFN
jgi:hypothetical protein